MSADLEALKSYLEGVEIDFSRHAKIHAAIGAIGAALREKDEEIARLKADRRQLFGYISAFPGWSDKHPEEVQQWWESGKP